MCPVMAITFAAIIAFALCLHNPDMTLRGLSHHWSTFWSFTFAAIGFMTYCILHRKMTYACGDTQIVKE